MIGKNQARKHKKMKYATIKNDHQTAVNAIMEKNQVIWAFSNDQLAEGMKKINITEKSDLISIGMGGFAPKINIANLTADMKAEEERYKKALKDAKEARDEAIAYELHNHEALYTVRIYEVVEIFAGIYTKEEIKKVYIKEKNKCQCQTCGQFHESIAEASKCCRTETKKAEAEEEEQEREESRGK